MTARHKDRGNSEIGGCRKDKVRLCYKECQPASMEEVEQPAKDKVRQHLHKQGMGQALPLLGVPTANQLWPALQCQGLSYLCLLYAPKHHLVAKINPDSITII